jgi:predicted N-acyltransferase
MIRFSARESLRDVAAAEWDALVADRSFYLCHSWLSAQDSGQPIDAVYLLARSCGRLVGALPVYRVREETNAFYRPERCADGRWQGHYLIAGARRAYTNGLLIADDLAPAQRSEVTHGLLARLRARAAELDALGALFLYLPTSAARSLSVGLPGGHPVLTAMEAVLDLHGQDFDGYLQTLPGHRRRVIRHEIDVFGRAGLTIVTEPAAGVWKQMVPLLANVQRRYGSGAPGEHWRQLLRRQAADLAGHATVFTCRRDGRLLGACLGYAWQGTLYLKLCGFDYDRLCGSFEYFNLVYYAPIRHVYEKGLSRIHYGREAFEAKLNRGARLAPLWSMEIPVPGRPPPLAAPEWNRATAARWRARFSRSSRDFSDPGWSLWGCDAGAGVA